MSVLHITDDTFQAEVLEHKGLVLVDFWAPWCAPCRMLGPIFEELGEEMGEKIRIAKVNVDEERSVAQKYGIMSIPTVFLVKDGEVVETMIGVQPKESYLEAIEKHS